MRPAPDQANDRASFREELYDSGMLLPTGIDGVYGRSEEFERLLTLVDRLARGALVSADTVELSFPPVMSRATYDRLEYLRRFSSAAGVVSVFDGAESDHASLMRAIDAGDSLEDFLSASDLALVSACCHPVYPWVGGPIPPDGLTVTLLGQCFRREPSVDPFRLQWFRQREHVRIATPAETDAWRLNAAEAVSSVFEVLGLPYAQVAASDAFFGRAGRLLARSQRQLELKLEFAVSVGHETEDVACASINLHRDHFCSIFGIETPDGVANSACVGFGLERITIALLAVHGLNVASWPNSVVAALGVA